MNLAKTIKLAPTVILVAFLTYAGYSIHASAVDPGEDPVSQVKDISLAATDIDTAADEAEVGQADTTRDPFQVVKKPVAAAAEQGSRNDASANFDRLAEIVHGLKLDATFLQGGDEVAIINGRVYSKGQQLITNASSDGSLSPLVVMSVLPAKVTLRGGDKDYSLVYPDQLVLSQRPHSAPRRAPGKSTTGNRPGTSSRAGFAPRTEQSRRLRIGIR